jgi:putative ABC transport system permease protein
VPRIALRCLFHDRVRLAAALTGVAVATVLMLVQVGIYFGFAEAASAPVRHIRGEVWVMSRDHRQLDHSPVLPTRVGVRLRADPCVRRARAVIFQFTTLERADGTLDPIELVGVDAGAVMPWSMARGLPGDLAPLGAVTIDARDATLAGTRDPIGATVRISGRPARVAALSRGLRGNFGIHPIVFGSAATVRVLSGMAPGQAQYWVLDLARPACTASTLGAIERDGALRALRTEDFAARIERELLDTSGIGVALAFVALLGFAVGGAVVAQTLLASLRQHRRELAMLKALGARPSELIAFVAIQTMFLAVVGVALGVGLALVVRSALTGLAVPVRMTDAAVGAGAAAICTLCVVASAMSVRAVLRIEATEVLR